MTTRFQLHSWTLIAATLICFVWSASALGTQALRLNRSEVPPIGDHSYIAAIIAELDAEINALPNQDVAPVSDRQLALRAQVDLRILTRDLLVEAERDAATGSIPALIGLTLFLDRGDIDAFLAAYVSRARATRETPDDDVEPMRALIKAFTDRSVEKADDVRTTDVEQLDRTLAYVFAPLADAYALHSGEAAASHWPHSSQPTEQQAGPALAALRSRFDALVADESLRSTLEGVLSFLERGSSFAEWRSQVLDGIDALTQVADFLDALQRATWLDDAGRNEFDGRVTTAVQLFAARDTRDEGLQSIASMAPTRQLLDALSSLVDAQVLAKGTLQEVQTASLVVETTAAMATDDEFVVDPRVLLSDLINRITAHRTLDEPELDRPTRVTYKELSDRCVEVEERILSAIDRLTAEPNALADPDLGSLVGEHRQYVEDLERLGRIEDWKSRIRAIDANASDGFDRQVAKMVKWLLNPVRRHDAIRAMQQFEQQLNIFVPMTDEDLLQNPGPTVIAATGGLQQELAALIATTRIEWAHSWGRGDGVGSASQRMMLYARLLRAIRETSHIIALEADGRREILDRWSAWRLTPSMIARTLNDPPGRVKLACAMAAQLDDEALARQLKLLDVDAPVGRVMAHLSLELQPMLEQLPVGVAGTLGQIMHPPSNDAWLGHRREQLARLCRYAMEAEHARAELLGKKSVELSTFTNKLALELLDELGHRHAPLAPLIGFDGSDPMAEH